MAKRPDRDPAKHSKKDPAKPTRAKAARPDSSPLDPSLADILNPAIGHGRAGVGSQTGSPSPPVGEGGVGGREGKSRSSTRVQEQSSPSSHHLPTPTPIPSPQGGGEERASGLQQPPDNSFDRRADFSAAHRARKSTQGKSAEGCGERPQTDYVAKGPTGIDPELADALGYGDSDPTRPLTGEPSPERDELADIFQSQREQRHRPMPQPVTLGVGASMQALESLLREGREEFRSQQLWTPHRPPRPEKSEGGRRLVIKSDFDPKGDQPTAIADLVEGVRRNDRTQVLLGVTGSGKTFTMAKVIEATQRPALILAPNKTLAAQLYGEFRSFFPDNAVEYFVSYYDYYQPEAYIPRTDT